MICILKRTYWTCGGIGDKIGLALLPLAWLGFCGWGCCVVAGGGYLFRANIRINDL